MILLDWKIYMGEQKHNTVLITTSGLGNRLGNITKYTNKALVRLGKVATISRIIESYPQDTKFIMTIGYYGDHIKQYVPLAHPDIEVEFVNIGKYEGDGSSLLYSMYAAKKHLQCPFIFHACDSIIDDYEYNGRSNVCFSKKSSNATHYRTHEIRDNKIIQINEKGEYSQLSNMYNIHVGVTYIKNYKEFWNCATKLLSEYPTDTSLSDCHVITEMINSGIDFTALSTNKWYDTGNIQSLSEAKYHFEELDDFRILDKEEENIFILNNEYVIKFFHDPKIINDRVDRLKYLKNYGPELIARTRNFYKYRYIDGVLASDSLDLNEFKNALDDIYTNFWIAQYKDPTEFKKTIEDFYINKTKKRIIDLHTQIPSLKDHTNLSINSVNMRSIESLIEEFKNIFIKDSILDYTTYHGDFVLDNLVLDNNKFKFLDWRQNFGGDLDGGDMYYDLAKMNHSFSLDHKLIINGNFKITKNTNNDFYIDVMCKHSSTKKKEIFINFINEHNLNMSRINALTGLIWINMSPLHVYPLNELLYLLGTYTLQYYIDEYKNKKL